MGHKIWCGGWTHYYKGFRNVKWDHMCSLILRWKTWKGLCSQLEEWKATGLDCFRMLHVSKVKQFSSRFSSFCIMSNGLFLYVPFSSNPFHLIPWQCLSVSHTPFLSNLSCNITSFFWAFCLLLGSLHKARDEEGCLPSLSSGLPND